MRYFALFTVMAVLTGCSWETYKNSQGQTTLRQKYPTGTAVSYEDGTYSRNMRNNQYRPERHAVLPNQTDGSEQGVRGQNWQKPKFQNR